MKRIILSISLCLCFYGSMSAQMSESEMANVIMKKYNEELAKRRKAAERARQEKIKTEQRHARQQQGLERTFTRQMDNLNSYSTDNFVQGPQQPNVSRYYQATTYKQGNKKTVPQATPKKNTNNNSADKKTPPQYGGSNSQIPTGKGYTGDRYTKKSSGYGKNKPQQQANYSESTIRGMVKPGRTMYNNTVISSSANIKPRISVPQSLQPVNRQNGGKGKTDQTLTKQNDATKQKNPTNTQLQKKNQLPVQDKAVTVNKFGKIVIDTSKGPIYPDTQKDQMSTDFDNTVVKIPDNRNAQQQQQKVTVYEIPQEVYKLSPKANDNNLSDNNNNKLPAKPKTSSDEITEHDLYKESMKLMYSGATLSEWAEISGYGYSKSVKTKTIVKRRK